MPKKNGWPSQLVKAYYGEQLTCPSCGKNTVECHCYVFPDGIGYVEMKCNGCGDHIRFDRVKYPEGVKVEIEEIE